MWSRIGPAVGLFVPIMKTCRFLTSIEFYGQMCTYQILKKGHVPCSYISTLFVPWWYLVFWKCWRVRCSCRSWMWIMIVQFYFQISWQEIQLYVMNMWVFICVRVWSKMSQPECYSHEFQLLLLKVTQTEIWW